MEAKLGQAIRVNGQQFQVMLNWAAGRGGSLTYITLSKPPPNVISDAISAGNAVGVSVNVRHILPY